MIVASPACWGAPMIVSLFEMPCTPCSRLSTTSAILLSLMADSLSYHVTCDVEQREPGPHDGAPVHADFPAIFEIPARGLTDLDRRGQDRRKNRDRPHQTPGQERIAKAVGQVEHEVAEPDV